jgi:cytochrome d ubiquinol oxidase subunit I
VFEVSSFTQLLFNPWAWLEYAHNMCAAVVTASFVMAAVGALYLLQRRQGPYGHIFLKLGVTAGIVACVLQIFPTGDLHGKYMAKNQPTAIAGMEGLFHTEKGAGMIVMGQPNYDSQTIDNPLRVNKVLSFLIYGTTSAEVEGLDHFPKDQWPSTLPLLFYSYHIMVGLGTWFLALMGIAALYLWRKKLESARWLLWCLLLSWPLPYVATTAGWMTAEIGRQPWLVFGLVRTSAGASSHVSAGNSLFTLLGFLGMYTLLSLLWIIVVYNLVQDGPPATADAVTNHQSLTA